MASAREAAASRLAARAEALERELAQVILELDDAAVARLAAIAPSIGFTDEEIRALFGRSVGTHIPAAFSHFAEQTAVDAGLPAALPAVDIEAERAVARLLDDLADGAREVIARLTDQALAEGWGVHDLERAIRDQVTLNETQNQWVRNFERKLRSNKRKALRNTLRDRRSDPTLLSDKPLSESQIDSQVRRYRERLVRWRSLRIARHELIRASNGAEFAVYDDADKRRLLPEGVRKFWWHRHDKDVRHAHLQVPLLNPDGVPLDASFVTPLGPMRYPLDPLGSAENVLGCRCVPIIGRFHPEGAT